MHRSGSLAEALDLLGRVLIELGAGRVAVNAEPPLDGVDLGVSLAADRSRRRAGRARQGRRERARQGRLVPLLPPVHIALAPTSALTTDLFTWTAGRGGAMPSALTLVSGPSKTADIEQTMAIGVHGPKRLIVILYQDS